MLPVSLLQDLRASTLLTPSQLSSPLSSVSDCKMNRPLPEGRSALPVGQLGTDIPQHRQPPNSHPYFFSHQSKQNLGCPEPNRNVQGTENIGRGGVPSSSHLGPRQNRNPGVSKVPAWSGSELFWRRAMESQEQTHLEITENSSYCIPMSLQ